MNKVGNKFGDAEVSHISESIKSNPEMLEKAIHDLLSDEMKEEVVTSYTEAFKKVFSGGTLTNEEKNKLQGVWENIKISQPEKLRNAIRTQYDQYVDGLGKKSEQVSIKDIRDNIDEVKASKDFEEMFWGDINNFIAFTDHLLAGGKTEDFTIPQLEKESEPDLIDTATSRTAQIENDKDSSEIDIQKITQYINNNNAEFKNHPDGSVDFPNGTHIPSKRKMNALTKSVCGDKAETYKSYTHLGGKEGDFPSEDIIFNSLKPLVKEKGGTLQEDGYTAILGGEKELQQKLINGNFPEDWNEKEKMSALLYVAPQLYGVNHINAKSLQVLRLRRHVDDRGVIKDRLKSLECGLIWVRNA